MIWRPAKPRASLGREESAGAEGVLNVFPHPRTMQSAMEVHEELLGNKGNFMLYQTWDAFGDYFRPPPPRPDLSGIRGGRFFCVKAHHPELDRVAKSLFACLGCHLDLLAAAGIGRHRIRAGLHQVSRNVHGPHQPVGIAPLRLALDDEGLSADGELITGPRTRNLVRPHLEGPRLNRGYWSRRNRRSRQDAWR
jgi:hypothetical protein